MPNESPKVLGSASNPEGVAKYGLRQQLLTLNSSTTGSSKVDYQPLIRTNPFDRNVASDEPLLEVGIDLQSFATNQRITDKQHIDLAPLCQLASLRTIRVFGLPVSGSDLEQLLKEHGIPCAAVHDATGLPFLREMAGDESREEIVIETDIIVTASPTRSNSEPRAFWRKGPGEALEVARLLLVHKGCFEIARGYSVDNSLYLLYRHWKLFPKLQVPWSIAAFRHNSEKFPSGLHRQLNSLWNRQELICQAADYCGINSFRTQSQRQIRVSLYHFSYFIMLATGLFDDLAWIACKFHNLPGHGNEMRVGLKEKTFQKFLATKNSALAKYLRLDEVQLVLDVFYSIRHRLQHRDFLVPTMVWAHGDDGGALELPDDVLGKIDKLVGRSKRKDWGVLPQTGRHLDPAQFVRRGLSSVATVHDDYMSKIPWRELLSDADESTKLKLQNLQELFDSGVWRYLQLSAQPIWF